MNFDNKSLDFQGVTEGKKIKKKIIHLKKRRTGEEQKKRRSLVGQQGGIKLHRQFFFCPTSVNVCESFERKKIIYKIIEIERRERYIFIIIKF